MRTLHADLTAAQQSASRTPYLRLAFRSRDRATSRTYATTDNPNRILDVQQAEGRYGAQIAVSGVPFAVSAIITLSNDDGALTSVDFKGYRLDIGWGLVTGSGAKYSEGEPLFVVNQRFLSVGGRLELEFHCVSLWEYMRLLWVNKGSVASTHWDADTSVRHILLETLGGSELAACIQDDGGVFTDQTADAASNAANDVQLLPATPATNDAAYFGLDAVFDTLSIDLTTVGGGLTLAWEYWDGGAWSALSSVVDNTSDFDTGELKTVTFDKPTDWATTTVNSQGPFYYIRARVTAAAGPSQPIATRIYAGHDTSMALDTSDAAQGDDFMPNIQTDYRTNMAAAVEAALDHTLMGVVLRNDGFHAIYIDNAQGSFEYVYDIDGDHTVHVSLLEDSVIVPNKITYASEEPARALTPTYSGSDTDSTSETAIGTIEQVRIDPAIGSDAAAVLQAQRAVKRLLRDAFQGDIEVPMNCGQEVWDRVQVQDNRLSVNYAGRVSQIIRTYQPGYYRMRLLMGGTERAVVHRVTRSVGSRDAGPSNTYQPGNAIIEQQIELSDPSLKAHRLAREERIEGEREARARGSAPAYYGSHGAWGELLEAPDPFVPPGQSPEGYMTVHVAPAHMLEGLHAARGSPPLQHRITGSMISPTAITATLLAKESQPYNSTSDFSGTAYNGVQWSSGNIAFADGSTIAINSGSSAGLSDSTTYYFYLTLSSGVVAGSTTYTDAVGAGKVMLALVAVGISTDGDAPTILPFYSKVATISAVAIAANVIVASHIRASTITAAKLTISTLDAITADMGTLTAGQISVGSITINADNEQILMGSASAPLTGIGVFLGKDGADYEFRAGNPAGAYVHWNGSSLTVTGSILTSLAAGTEKSIQSISHDLVFSASDADTVSWGSGTITMLEGTTYSIDAGNTGNMAARTYIYLNIGASLTVLQTTTTPSTAVGTGKILLAVAENSGVADEAFFFVYHSIGGQNITAAHIAASTITAAEMNVTQLSAITADMGTITAGTVTGATIQSAVSGARVVLNSNQLSIYGGDSGTPMLRFLSSAGTQRALIYAHASNAEFIIHAAVNQDIEFNVSGTGIIKPSGAGIDLGSFAASFGEIWGNDLAVDSLASNNSTVIEVANGDDINPATTLGSNLGDATHVYGKVFFGANYQYITASGTTMEFYVQNGAASQRCMWITGGAAPKVTFQTGPDFNGQAATGWPTSATATAGGATLPAAPEGFIQIDLAGVAKKVPYYTN